MNLPIVVRIVPAKNMDCPKLQLGSLVTFLAADTPRLFAFTTSTINASNSASEKAGFLFSNVMRTHYYYRYHILCF